MLSEATQVFFPVFLFFFFLNKEKCYVAAVGIEPAPPKGLVP